MPLFEWEGKRIDGTLAKGTLRADSVLALRVSLRREGIFLLKAKEKKEIRALRVSPRKKVKPMTVAVFTRQLSTMISSGLPLVQSLEVLSTQVEDRYFARIVREVKEKVEGGSKFADALKDYPQSFDELYVNLVVAGEESGTLDVVLSRLAQYMEKMISLKRKIKSALIYPISIVVVAIGVVMILLIFVIPVFETMFKDMGAELPAPTQLVVNLSRLIKVMAPYLAGSLFGLFLGFRGYYRTEKGKRMIDSLVLKIPILGILVVKSAVARVTRTLATLLSSGVSILEGLFIVARLSGNKIVEEAMLTARARISEGKTISEPLEESNVFPPMVVQMVKVGESTGNLDSMLNKIADFYEEDVDNLVSNLTSIMEPMIIIFLGVILGGLIISMYLPIFRLGTVVG